MERDFQEGNSFGLPGKFEVMYLKNVTRSLTAFCVFIFYFYLHLLSLGGRTFSFQELKCGFDD